MNCLECQRLKKKLAETEEALIRTANKLLMVRRALEGNEENKEKKQYQ